MTVRLKDALLAMKVSADRAREKIGPIALPLSALVALENAIASDVGEGWRSKHMEPGPD